MIAAVVLAAGQSSRMGRPKALLPLPDGRSFLHAIAASARAGGVARVVVVLGPPHAAAIAAALPSGLAAAENPDPTRGMLSSVQAGVAALPAQVEAALVWPVDLPLVRAETVRAILAAGAAAPGQLIIPEKGGRGGHPVYIPRARFAVLGALAPDRGLKALLQAYPSAVTRLPVEDGAVLTDIDTPEDFAQLANLT
jgi:CTP:molybdopterin cytidylyltransferase MocA